MITYYEGGKAVQHDDYGHEYAVSVPEPNLRAYAAWYMTINGQFTEHARTGPAFWSHEEKRWVFIMAKPIKVSTPFVRIAQ